MKINGNQVQNWKADTAASVLFYNSWFRNFAPRTFNETRDVTILRVRKYFAELNYLVKFDGAALRSNPDTLSMLRMMTCPPIAKDRLIGLSGASSSLVGRMEKKKGLSPRMSKSDQDSNLALIADVLIDMFDHEILPWLKRGTAPEDDEIEISSLIIADRLSSSLANPIIRNAQEFRQLLTLETLLKSKGYTEVSKNIKDWKDFKPGEYGFRFNVRVFKTKSSTTNIPVDMIVMPFKYEDDEFPILIEAKSAGDFTNTNKRRKEEVTKFAQLRKTYGDSVEFILYLCGYFGSDYLGYNAAEGIDWVWEHRTEDILKLID